jgi:hypothetical protein
MNYVKIYFKKSQIYVLTLRGDQDMLLWLYNVGFKNRVKLNRFLIWKKYGFCPSGLNLFQQKKILSEKMNPNDFYETKIIIPKKFISVTTLRQLNQFKQLKLLIPKD